MFDYVCDVFVLWCSVCVCVVWSVAFVGVIVVVVVCRVCCVCMAMLLSSFYACVWFGVGCVGWIVSVLLWHWHWQCMCV